MKSTFAKILVALLIIFIIIQFIRPAKNQSSAAGVYDINTKYKVPDSVQKIFKASCYDCHSNNTVYPWYAEIQPVGWWLSSHVNDGKRGLNFSEFTSYPIGKQYKRLQDISEQVKSDEMPLSSYLLIHTYAKLTIEQKTQIYNWVNDVRNLIKSTYPADSLKRKSPQPS